MRDKPWFAPLIGIAGLLAILYNLRAYSALWSDPKQEDGTAASLQASGGAGAAQPGNGASAAPARPIAAVPEKDLARVLAALPPSSRDPFQFAEGAAVVAEGSAAPALVLQGTLMGRRRVAWINQRALSEGEQIEGHWIERIEADRVIVRRGNEEYELWPSR